MVWHGIIMMWKAVSGIRPIYGVYPGQPNGRTVAVLMTARVKWEDSVVQESDRMYVFGVIVGAAGGVLIGCALMSDAERISEAEKAAELCRVTGGELLVTEYNSKTGLTMNCFYPVDDSIVAPAQMDL